MGRNRDLHTSANLGVCHYCGRIERTTRDHKIPKRLRLILGLLKADTPTVTSCWSCQKLKGDRMTYDEYRAWLLTPEGYGYMRRRHEVRPKRIPLAPCAVPASSTEFPWFARSADERERHFCASHKPCTVLRKRMLVLGDGPASAFTLVAA